VRHEPAIRIRGPKVPVALSERWLAVEDRSMPSPRGQLCGVELLAVPHGGLRAVVALEGVTGVSSARLTEDPLVVADGQGRVLALSLHDGSLARDIRSGV
jgi:hypothetical protein